MSLELLNKRLQYRGGNQQQRFIKDKQKSLKKALLYSYQAATALLQDGREFRCLINPDKNKPAYDNKILSIPYKDICLNSPQQGKMSQGIQQINIKTGDVFTWKETNTHWLVYLEAFEEDAYFRSQIRRCDQWVEINNQTYWVYLRGPIETAVEWQQKKKVNWSLLNYSEVMYITADENTNNYFERFQKIKIIDPRYNKKKTWQITSVDPYYGDGILQVFLKEYFENEIEDEINQKNKNINNSSLNNNAEFYITGPYQVKQYSNAYYEIHNIENGYWYIKRNQQEMNLNSNKNKIHLNFSGELGIFTLIYRVEGQDDIILNITVVPL